MSAALVVGAAGCLLLAGYAAEWIFRRFGLPDVLVLMLLGLALHLGGALRPEQLGLFGEVLSALALVVILFEGALRLELRALGRLFGRAAALALLNFLPASALATFVGLSLGLAAPVALSLGFALGATSTTVVLPLLPGLGLGERASTLLSLESTLGDVLSVVGVLAILGAARAGALSVATLGRELGLQLGASLCVGVAGGLAWALLLRPLRAGRTSLLPTVAALLILYALLVRLGLSGAIGTFAFGLALGNAPGLLRRRAAGDLSLTDAERLFFAELSFLLKVFFFTYLGAVIPFARPAALFVGAGLGLALAALRQPLTQVALHGFPVSDRKAARALGPRGLVAAVVAQIPIAAGWSGGQRAAAAVFGAILTTVAASSLMLWRIRHAAERENGAPGGGEPLAR